MTDFNDFKQKMLAKLGQAADATMDIANKAADKAKAGGRIAKLRMEIASENENMKKTYIEIGKLYYDTHKNDPDGFFIQLCEEIALAERNIADKEAEIETLKTVPAEDDPDVDVVFENVVADEEAAAEEPADEAPTDAASAGDAPASEDNDSDAE